MWFCPGSDSWPVCLFPPLSPTSINSTVTSTVLSPTHFSPTQTSFCLSKTKSFLPLFQTETPLYTRYNSRLRRMGNYGWKAKTCGIIGFYSFDWLVWFSLSLNAYCSACVVLIVKSLLCRLVCLVRKWESQKGQWTDFLFDEVSNTEGC